MDTEKYHTRTSHPTPWSIFVKWNYSIRIDFRSRYKLHHIDCAWNKQFVVYVVVWCGLIFTIFFRVTSFFNWTNIFAPAAVRAFKTILVYPLHHMIHTRIVMQPYHSTQNITVCILWYILNDLYLQCQCFVYLMHNSVDHPNNTGIEKCFCGYFRYLLHNW